MSRHELEEAPGLEGKNRQIESEEKICGLIFLLLTSAATSFILLWNAFTKSVGERQKKITAEASEF